MMKIQKDGNKKTIIKAIFAWEDEKEEKWLEQMAADGWKLTSVAPYVYHFERSQPEKVVFRLDYKNSIDKDYSEYLALFEDAGWELHTTFMGWHYFKINPENQDAPEIYNSAKAKAQKYRRLLLAVLPMMPIYIFLFNPSVGLFRSEGALRASALSTGLRIFFIVFFLFMIYCVIRVLVKIKALESNSKE